MDNHPYLKFKQSNYENGILVSGLTNNSIKNVQIPIIFNDSCVTEIGEFAFRNANIASIFISKSVLVISWGAFKNCSSLSDVQFEEGSRLEKVCGSAFNNCSQLKIINFPSSLKEIESNEYKVFNGVNLECFSYLGTSNFSYIDMFSSVSIIHVSSDYAFDKLGYFDVTNDNVTCNIALEEDPPEQRLCTSPMVQYRCKCRASKFISVEMFVLL